MDVSCEVRWLSPHGTPRSSMGYERKSNWKSNWIPSGNVVNISITLENLIFFIGKSTISMAMFNSYYIRLPEGINWDNVGKIMINHP